MNPTLTCLDDLYEELLDDFTCNYQGKHCSPELFDTLKDLSLHSVVTFSLGNIKDITIWDRSTDERSFHSMAAWSVGGSSTTHSYDKKLATFTIEQQQGDMFSEALYTLSSRYFPLLTVAKYKEIFDTTEGGCIQKLDAVYKQYQENK